VTGRAAAREQFKHALDTVRPAALRSIKRLTELLAYCSSLVAGNVAAWTKSARKIGGSEP